MHFFDLMQPMLVNGTCPGKKISQSWKTLEFGLCRSRKVLEKGMLMSVRTVIVMIGFVTLGPLHHA